jgi:hypothetical protein
MSWVRSIGVALLTGMVALFGAGTLASLIVEWHDISSFEGGAGFFVVGMALLGGCAGFVVGLIVARVVVRERKRPFLTGVGASCATVASILALAAGVSWLLADIPPQIDGEELFMLAEIRWPESGATAPASIAGVPYLRLGALRGSTVRRLEHGALFVEDARQESGRWIVPGAVPIFTSRGGRLLDFGSDGRSIAAFEVPLPRYPWELHRQWSAWLPTQRAGEPARADQFTYRFKVVLKTEPLRTDTIGSFEVDTIVDYFYPVSDASKPAASATFRVRYKGQPIPEIQTAETVSAVAASRPALFVTVAESASEPPCVLLVDEGGTIRVERVKGCGTPVTVGPLTSDSAHFDAARTHERLPGWVDRVSFARPGLFQLDSAILDTRNMTTVSFLFPDDLRPNMGVPPLDLSPDEQSFVWLVQGPDEDPRLGITNWRTGVSHVLPIDRSRMRYNTPSSLGPQWVRHHFQWIRGPEGTDVLAERPAFAPLPYRGDLALGKAGEIQTYTLRPGGEPLRTAMVNLLVRGFGGERMPDEPGGYQQRVRLNGKVLGVSVVDSPGYVYISMDAPDGDPQAMKAIATKLDAALATGEYDALFVAPEKNQ